MALLLLVGAFFGLINMQGDFQRNAHLVKINWFEQIEDDQGQEIEFDMIGVCYEFAENTPKEIIRDAQGKIVGVK